MGIGIIVGIVIISIFLIVAASSKGSKTLDKKPKKIISFYSDREIDDVFKSILSFSKSSDYKVEAIEEDNYKIVFGDDASLTSYGFFYPIYLTSETNNKTKVEIGIKSKAAQIGPVVTKSHEKFVSNIKVAVLSE